MKIEEEHIYKNTKLTIVTNFAVSNGKICKKGI